MSRFNPIVASIFFAAALGACDRRDREDDQTITPSESGVPDAAATTDGMSPTNDTMPGSTTSGGAMPGDTASDGTRPGTTASDGTMSPDSGTTASNGMSNGMSTGTAGSGGDMGSTQDPAGANRNASTGTASSAAGTNANASGTSTAAGSADADFYRQALGSGVSELALSEHAARTSSSAEVKRVAEMLVKDHRDLNGKLRTASGMNEPAPPPAEAKAAEDIKSKTGAAFDTAYLRKMSEGHKKSIALYQTAANSAGDSETRRLASAALPKLREHAGHVERALTAAGKNDR